MTDSITENDVLFGRGGATNNHVGNKKFRTIVTDHQPEYLSARKKEKALISKRIVRIVRENGGRFLRRDDRSGLWVEVGDRKASEKTSQALREGLDVRATTTKSPRRNSESSASTHENAARKRKRFEKNTEATLSPSMGSTAGEVHSMPDLEEEIPRMMPSFVFQQPLSLSSVDIESVVEL